MLLLLKKEYFLPANPTFPSDSTVRFTFFLPLHQSLLCNSQNFRPFVFSFLCILCDVARLKNPPIRLSTVHQRISVASALGHWSEMPVSWSNRGQFGNLCTRYDAANKRCQREKKRDQVRMFQSSTDSADTPVAALTAWMTWKDVFLQCVQPMLAVVLLLRFSSIVDEAGFGEN